MREEDIALTVRRMREKDSASTVRRMREEDTASSVRRMRGRYCFSCEENERKILLQL